MSGIAAVFNLDGAPVDSAIVDRMLAAAPYRGRDGMHSWSEGPIALGYARLNTTSESVGESQPLVDASGNLALVFSGRIDNRNELVRELTRDGIPLRHDAEFVLAAYQRWGDSMPERIVGDFALALWDRTRHRLICARDALGVAALYYFSDGRVFVCASELHQILVHQRVSRAPNEPMIAEVLAGSTRDAEETLYRGIYRLPGSFMLAVSSNGVTKHRYFDLEPERVISYRSDAEYAEHFHALFWEAVRCRMRSEGGVVADLSGGLDSSSVVLAVRDLLDSRAANVESFNAVSMIFEYPAANEERYIAKVEARTHLRSYRLNPLIQTREQCLATVRQYRDLPDEPNLAMFDIASVREAFDSSRVWLGGSGADDFLGGSDYLYADLIRRLRFGKVLLLLRGEYALSARDPGRPGPLLSLYRSGLLPLVPPWLRRTLKPYLKKAESASAITPEFARRTSLVERIQRPQASPRCRDFAQRDVYLAYVAGGRLRLLEMLDRFAARHGMEARHPFYDRRLLEFFVAIPEDQRIRDGVTKFVMRGAMQPTLPAAIFARRDKADFGCVYPQTLRALGGERFCDSLAIARAGWVDGESVRAQYVRMNALFAAGDPEYLTHIGPLWNVFALELWFGEIFDQTSKPDAGASKPSVSGDVSREENAETSPARPRDPIPKQT
jgi:asparagine synthase (glutamine-hydrolysing)